nr:immunoglobulin heavy chain junction region [Macaca mulatta]MOW19870.1 immunoglobulin heavy chain junction region [Macaca mulatta]MOW21259.1 immunoglobulin heavy chain junction region [Macaca mulatta]MOW21287.1 immunoglobulin heavy chain junction region [Macaca mulatta]MOW22028.1 immunoglobulin heavy chain junction region [Macaca mulatta]
CARPSYLFNALDVW